MALRRIVLGLATLWPASVLAQQPSADPAPPPAPAATELAPVGVTATRGPRPIDEVPATVSIITDEQLQRQNAIRPSDVVRYEPGVSVANQPARGGQTNYVIRGIGGNRVLVLQDGMRLQDFPGSNLGAGNYTRNFVDLDSVRRIEIVRGPASALYGSDALGGVVNYIMKDPSEFLIGGKDVYLSARFGYNGSDNSVAGTTIGAVRKGNSEFMLLYTRRNGHETIANGTISPNPQDYQTNNLLARLVLRPTDADTIRVTGNYTNMLTSTEVRTEETTTFGSRGAPSTAVLASHGNDTAWRGWLAVNWVHDEPILFIDRVQTRLSYSYLNRREQSDQARASFTGLTVPTTANRRRLSDFAFDQGILSTDIQFNSAATLLGVEHAFTYGVTMDVTNTSRPRDRVELNLTNGTSTNVVAGETYPNKNFPDTRTIQAGAYIQDEIRYGRLEVTPALRLDYYGLRPSSDADFIRSSGGTLKINSVSDVSVSPKLGLLYHLTEQYSLYGQYAAGYRAPPYDSTNFGFTNRVQGYQILPAVNLKSESSNGFEAGLRGRFANASFQLTGFYNNYSDFIDTRVVGNVGGLTQFQYVNVPTVRIWGAEARAQYNITPEVTLRGAFAWADSEDTQTHRPVDSVDPIKLVTGLGWKSPRGFGVEGVLTHAWRHNRVSDRNFFQAPSYTVVDLMAQYELNEHFAINLGLFNVFNERYFVSQDVTGLARTSALRDLYAAPGRYFAFNAVVRW